MHQSRVTSHARDASSSSERGFWKAFCDLRAQCAVALEEITASDSIRPLHFIAFSSAPCAPLLSRISKALCNRSRNVRRPATSGYN
jgi:hypothetical protein